MLVLSRYPDEVIRIGDEIRVTVLRIQRDGRVRIGIEAPASVEVHRQERYEQIHGKGAACASKKSR